ncbi:hypothetical protein ES703_16685 [subsurface metagenome]
MIALLGLALAGIAAGLTVALIVATREPEELPPEEEEPLPEEEVIDATLRSGWVWWAGLPAWREVYEVFPNEWPAASDITFTWRIKNTGNVGAYFQPYMFTPGDWLYLDPDDELEVEEDFHTPTLPVSPYGQFYRVYILARKVDGERIGAVWTSEEIEVTYV